MLKSKIEYIVMLIAEFAKRYKITSQESFRYLRKYKGFDLCDVHYGIMHTLSLEENLDSLYSYCNTIIPKIRKQSQWQSQLQ